MIRQRRRPKIGGATVALLLLVLTACLPRQAQEPTHYGLLTLEELGEAPDREDLHGLRLGVGPVTIPQVLRRAQIVTRDREKRYRFAELDRWAGLLEEDIARVLGENLQGLLGGEAMALYPWRPSFRPSHRVVVDVLRLDGELDGEAVLRARWRVFGEEGEEILAGTTSLFRESVRKEDYAALVRAESRLIGALSREIAAAVEGAAQRSGRGSPGGRPPAGG